jgi:hypothetical protein
MDGFWPGVLIVVALGIVIAVWVGSMSMDKSRITAYVEERGGRIISISWAPFGRGWFGEKNDRIYEVVYYDRDGNQHWATCKTSLFSGVYWTEDRVTHHKSGWYDSVAPGNEPGKPLIRQIPGDGKDDQAEEVRRLREENARLREQLGRMTSSESPVQPGRCPACGADIPVEAERCPSCEIALR